MKVSSSTIAARVFLSRPRFLVGLKDSVTGESHPWYLVQGGKRQRSLTREVIVFRGEAYVPSKVLPHICSQSLFITAV